MAKNPFQQAVLELNLLITGLPDESTLRALGGTRHIRFLQGNSPKGDGVSGGPKEDCRDGDEDGPVQLLVGGYGHVEGKNLAEAVDAMKARISGSAAVGSAPASAPAPVKSPKPEHRTRR